MYVLAIGFGLWLLWLPFYWYDVSSFYQGGYRIRSRRVRKAVLGLFYTSLCFMCLGSYWLYLNWFISLFVS